MKILGAAIFVVGVILWLGNVGGFFPTFPGVGYGTILLGGFLYRKGSDEQ
jgi:hypothetical protein